MGVACLELPSTFETPDKRNPGPLQGTCRALRSDDGLADHHSKWLWGVGSLDVDG